MIMYLQRGIGTEPEKGGSIRVISPSVASFFCLGVLVVLLPDDLEPVLEIFGQFNSETIMRLRQVVFEEFAKTENYGMIFTYTAHRLNLQYNPTADRQPGASPAASLQILAVCSIYEGNLK